VETRLPFLDHRLIEAIFAGCRAPSFFSGSSKPAQRTYLERRGLATNARRAEKAAYPTPVERWLAADDARVARRLLLSHDSAVLEYCERSAVRTMVERHARNPESTGDALYKLVSLEAWLRTCIARPAMSLE
jgi:hypothetical protein